jgi:hypothetical protein
MINSYRSTEEANRDKAQLVELLDALRALPSRLHRDECGAWIISGRAGCYVSTDGDGWLLVITPERELSKLAWAWVKKRLAFAAVTQDGDGEGCLRLDRLPTAAEAEEVRDVLGIWKAYSPEELARRREVGRRLVRRMRGQNGSVID